MMMAAMACCMTLTSWAKKPAEPVVYFTKEITPEALEYSLFWRGRVGTMLDPDASQGIAQPFYEQLWDIIVAKAEQDKSDVARMKEAGNFLMVYYLKIKDDVEKSKVFAGKIIEIDPTNETAAQIVAILKPILLFMIQGESLYGEARLFSLPFSL